MRLVHTNRVHKKTASTSTIVSGNNVPFILARAEGELIQQIEQLDEGWWSGVGPSGKSGLFPGTFIPHPAFPYGSRYILVQ